MGELYRHSEPDESFQRDLIAEHRTVGDSDVDLLTRIDGNHRLEATSEQDKFADYNVPFCIIFFRTEEEAKRYSRALFHNINYKQVPLMMEQNLRLIIGDEENFSDEDLRDGSSFGWPYYLTRKLHGTLDFSFVPHMERFLGDEPRTFLLQQLKFLTGKTALLTSNDAAAERFREAMSAVNGLLTQYPKLESCENPGLLGALLYYELQNGNYTQSFVRWVLKNHLHQIDKSNTEDFVKIFDRILESKQRTIFVSMPFGDDATEDHYHAIEEVCDEISNDFGLKPALHPERVDWFNDGTSYDISDKIFDMISGSGLLIGDLTHANVNVYNEIGFVMGKAKAEGLDTAHMLLILDESAKRGNTSVGFNLRSIKQIRFKKIHDLKKGLQKNIRLFYSL